MLDVPKKFELGKSKYDLNTYLGRFFHNVDIIDPRTLFVSEKRLNESIQLLENFKNGTLSPNITDSKLWEAQKIKQSTVHPDVSLNNLLKV
jgi:sideroflexin-5